MKILVLGPESKNRGIVSFLQSEGHEVELTVDPIDIGQLRESKIDYLISNGYAPILKEPIVSEYQRRIINIHPAYLPDGRGIYPNFWSYFQGSPKGVTIHYIDGGIDTGDIIVRAESEFSSDETLSSTLAKLVQQVEQLFYDNWASIVSGTHELVVQDKSDTAISYHSRNESERYMDLLLKRWETPISEVEDMGADFHLSGQWWAKYDEDIRGLDLGSHGDGDDPANELTVREVNIEDRRVIWKWWNDSVTRQMMKRNDYVEWDEHCAWFERTLADPNRVLCMALTGSKKVGVVRFDLRAEGVYEVSINLNPDQRGHGYAPQVLKKASEYVIDRHHPWKLFATLKKINVPSKKSFARAGFKYMKPFEHYQGLQNFLEETELYCELIPGDLS